MYISDETLYYNICLSHLKVQGIKQNSYCIMTKIKEPVSYNRFCVQGVQGIQGNWSRETCVFFGLIVMYSKQT